MLPSDCSPLSSPSLSPLKSIIYYLIHSPKLSTWLKDGSVQEALQSYTKWHHIERDPQVFSVKIDEDYVHCLQGVTRASFCNVYLEWIQYCAGKMETVRSWIFVLSSEMCLRSLGIPLLCHLSSTADIVCKFIKSPRKSTTKAYSQCLVFFIHQQNLTLNIKSVASSENEQLCVLCVCVSSPWTAMKTLLWSLCVTLSPSWAGDPWARHHTTCPTG